jgi:Kef-type K+ transport system membrane component KefB
MSESLRPLAGHAVFALLIQLALLLIVARLGAEICRRFAIPAVVGELAAGLILGPSVFGHFAPLTFHLVFPPNAEQFHLLEVVGTLGMILLLLLTGLETDLRLLRGLGRAAFVASLSGVLLPFALGFGLGMVMPGSYLAAPDHRVLFSRRESSMTPPAG